VAAALPDKPLLIEADKLLHPGGVVELRLLHLDGRGQTASGYFDQPALLAEAALRYHRRAEGGYITLNPLPASLLARASNQVVERARETTSDGEVRRRAWLPIDLDPTRPSGISASPHEHQVALEQAWRIREWLAAEWGWHAPLFADRGNGAHLLYAVDLPNEAASTDLITRCLASLAVRLGSEAVTLDRSVYNAARIWKLYGSVARKGEPLADRPPRRAQIISAPDPVERVTREQLAGLAALAGPNPASPAARDGGATRPPPLRPGRPEAHRWLPRFQHGCDRASSCSTMLHCLLLLLARVNRVRHHALEGDKRPPHLLRLRQRLFPIEMQRLQDGAITDGKQVRSFRRLVVQGRP
jgi:hypothetical protein